MDVGVDRPGDSDTESVAETYHPWLGAAGLNDIRIVSL